MLEPFVRGDDARNMDEAVGVGRGLSIASTTLRRTAANYRSGTGSPSGLIASIRPPVHSKIQQAAA